jgi:hypothetical protein
MKAKEFTLPPYPFACFLSPYIADLVSKRSTNLVTDPKKLLDRSGPW